jgi:hypothetical protein
MRRLSPVSVSEARTNGVAWLTGYAASVRSWLAIVVVVVAGLGGCRNRDVERLTAIKDSVCACKTVSCAEQEMKVVPQTTIKSTHRTQAIARDMLGCLAKLHDAERPVTDPDAEEPLDEELEPEPGAAPDDESSDESAAPASGPRTSAPASAKTR